MHIEWKIQLRHFCCCYPSVSSSSTFYCGTCQVKHSDWIMPLYVQIINEGELWETQQKHNDWTKGLKWSGRKCECILLFLLFSFYLLTKNKHERKIKIPVIHHYCRGKLTSLEVKYITIVSDTLSFWMMDKNNLRKR